MRTLSDLIDKNIKKDKLDKEVVEKKFQLRMQGVEKSITRQFEKAKYIVGKRLEMKKRHEGMYYFYFDVANKSYRTLYIFHTVDTTLSINSAFEVNIMNQRYGYGKEIITIPKRVYIKDLNRVLIDWCKILTDKLLEEEEK